jgi:hypothetical protein
VAGGVGPLPAGQRHSIKNGHVKFAPGISRTRSTGASRSPGGTGDDYRDHDLVFCYVDGESLRPDILSREFIKHAAACGLPLIRLHDMRHGACSLLLSGGCRSRPYR